jgi:hypothetical protein
MVVTTIEIETIKYFILKITGTMEVTTVVIETGQVIYSQNNNNYGINYTCN